MTKYNCFVIAYKRPTFLKKCLESLEWDERLNIIVVNNEPLNHGHTVVWSQGLSRKHDNGLPYFVTDCDIVVPKALNWVTMLISGLNVPGINKCGLELNTRHIPDFYPHKEQVIAHEQGIFRRPYNERYVYAPVDTTIAAYCADYHRYSIWGHTEKDEETAARPCRSLRTVYPYVAKHLTWHMTPEEIASEENQNYIAGIKRGSTHWSIKQKV